MTRRDEVMEGLRKVSDGTRTRDRLDHNQDERIRGVEDAGTRGMGSQRWPSARCRPAISSEPGYSTFNLILIAGAWMVQTIL